MSGVLPDWLDPLQGAEQMRAIDSWAIDERVIPSLTLMERAGSGLALAVDRLVPRGAIAVICGKGNNGGDGFVAARLLSQLGRSVRVFTLAGEDEHRGDAAENLGRLDGAHEPFTSAGLDDAAVIVDAILGTGFDGAPRGLVKAAIEAIAAHPAAVVSADIASGLDASTGATAGACVTATLTVTFSAAKPAHWIAPGKQLSGALEIIDIGIPAGAPEQADVGLLTGRVHRLVGGRDATSTKFSAGHVVVAGGSRGLTGAPCLACEAAMRAGAGYVTALVPASLQMIFELRLLEVMTRGLNDDDDGALTLAAATAGLDACERAGALVLGPGLGRSDGAFAFAREVAARAPVALVLDADGLNAYAGRLDALARRTAPTVLTPHAGELGRLLGVSSAQIGARRLHSAREAARLARAVVVLKGDDTIVVAPDGMAAVNGLSAPALATAGTGDVLGGVIAAFLAKGLDPFAAACAGVRRHAAAGRVAANAHGSGVIARDVVAALPRAPDGEPVADDERQTP